MMKGYFRLARPLNALGGSLTVLLSGHIAGPREWWPVITAMAAISFLSFAAYAWNDYIDLEIDRINKPGRPLPAGQVSADGAVIFSLAGTAISLLLAAFVNQATLFIIIGLNVLIYLYSWKLKCTVLLGNITVAVIIASCVIVGGTAAGNIRPVLAFFGIVFIGNLGREILKTMADYRGDSKHNCRTVSTAWGVKTSGLLVITILGITALAVTFVYFFENYRIIYLLLIISGIYPLYIYIAIIINNASVQTLEYASRLMKYSFFIWLLALALGTIGTG